ncbi:phosphate ABC transporter permease subunit PstC [Halalkalicoccus sp. NIPERK01]|uniref:phosphate ABC transporter permease subunit PstC n=1 Tax=Halalkalicoccus sp. NIPERK01 TaxID=3053469 RepID=UPI00256EA77D|nr:phosphate ABC transporter permease subunit PstC [Halalkalicoccus sp. NIPERK01]MDL5363653.1 phosphate ABC transporter permease subunit PstC [Halalkalicoccus sp. NIPERK01]
MSTETDTLDLAGGADRSLKERTIEGLLLLCTALSVFVTGAIVFTLAVDAIDFFTEVSPAAFFLGSDWTPAIEPLSFGVLPLVSGTLLVTVLSALIALPTGVGAAIYLSEYASSGVRSAIKPALEVLAGIPTVVYGYFALAYITPALGAIGLPVSTFNVLSASIMVGVMIIPMVSSLSEDAMSAVPDELRNAGYGLGATKFEVSTGIVVPAAISGIFSSFILALSRAIGETMIVTVAMGQTPRMIDLASFPDALFRSGQTMTSAMVELGTSDVSGGTTAYRSLFAIGLTLFAITFAMNLAANVVAARYQEEYR